MKQWLRFTNVHFEALFLVYMWLAAAGIAAVVGKPWLGLIGFATVLPFVLAYAWRVRRAH